MAVVRTHFCADRTAIYFSVTDTFLSPTKMLDVGSFTDTFRLSEPKTHKTADLSSSTDTFWLSEPIFMFGATELPDLDSSTATNFETNKTAGPR